MKLNEVCSSVEYCIITCPDETMLKKKFVLFLLLCVYVVTAICRRRFDDGGTVCLPLDCDVSVDETGFYFSPLDGPFVVN